jgi:hypothetical protein
VPPLIRPPGAIGLALAAYDIWRRIPPKHRKQLLKQAGKHGPRIAAKAVKYQRRRTGKPV